RGLAEADVIRAKGEAEAEAARTKSLAEAEGLKAKLLAEADGMKEKAEAWKHYNEAAVTQMLIEKLPEIARAVASPLAKIDRISLVNTGGGDTGMDRVTKGFVDVLAQVPVAVEQLTGLRINDLVKRVPALADGNGKVVKDKPECDSSSSASAAAAASSSSVAVAERIPKTSTAENPAAGEPKSPESTDDSVG
ncbi:MAG: hypothetical protein N2C14_19200, partial [Planctomycetales bacterium]